MKKTRKYMISWNYIYFRDQGTPSEIRCRSGPRYITSTMDKKYQPRVYASAHALNRYLSDKILVNQSKRKLSDTEIETLALGLGFITTEPLKNDRESENDAIQTDLYKRRVNIGLFFDNLEAENTATTRTKPAQPQTNKGHLAGLVPSTWTPKERSWSSDPQVRDHLKCLTGGPFRDQRGDSKNLTHPDILDAIKRLAGDQNIHILPADKGGATVIWQAADYDREALRQLTCLNNYEEIDPDVYEQRVTKLQQTCCDHANWLFYKRERNITKNERDAILNSPALGSPIYFLPKIHKEERKDTGTFAGRPIVATHSATVHLIDKYITKLTAPLLKLIPGSLIDSTHFMNTLPTGTLPPGSKLVTSDVTGLYPSIPQLEGIEATKQVYEWLLPKLREHCQTNGLLRPPNTETFGILLTTVLTNSYISFKKQRFFHQRTGTAMGMCVSVFFANCFMFKLTQLPIEHPPEWLLTFVRFIDDLFLIITSDCCQETLASFFLSISSEAIQYETAEPYTQIPMLDLLVSISPPEHGPIVISPYRKETAADTFVHYKSNHPPSTIRSIPYAQMLRLRRPEDV